MSLNTSFPGICHLLPQIPTTPVSPKWNGVLPRHRQLGFYALHLSQNFAPHWELCFSFLQATKSLWPKEPPNPNFNTLSPQTPKAMGRFRAPSSKCFCFCFLPLPSLPTALHHFWPLVSGSCFVTFVQIQKESPQTLPRCLYNSSERQQRKQERQEHKECSQ